MINDENRYIALQKWMATKLNLYGNELVVYAFIYSFQFKAFGNSSKVENKPIEIPMNYFVEWTGQSKRNVFRIIQKLENKGLIKVETTKGKNNNYFIVPEPVISAMKGDNVKNVTSDKMSLPTKNVTSDKNGMKCGQNVTSGSDKMSRVVVTNLVKTSDKMSPQTNTSNTNNTQTNTRIQNAQTRDDASASLSSTDTEDRYEDLSKTEIVFFEKQALKKLNETDETTGQKLYLTKDPRDQFPKAFLFMTVKDTNRFTDTEFELFKLVSMYTAFGPAKPLPTVSEEDARYVPPASEIGQEAHDAQQALVDWLFEGGPSPSSYAHDAPLQSRRQK